MNLSFIQKKFYFLKTYFYTNLAIRDISFLFLISRLSILIMGYLSTLVLVKGNWFGEPRSILDLFFRWDSGWYLSIVENGYFFHPGQESNVAFFPLYSMIVKFISYFLGNPKLVGIVISNLALLIAAIYLYKLFRLDFNKEISFKTVFYMFLFPTTFFFSIFYSEGLFILLVVSSFYYARKMNWFIASLLGFLLSLTRSVGVFILIPLLIEYFDINLKSWKIDFKKIKKDIVFLSLVPLGMFSYMFYLYIAFGDMFASSHASSAWNRHFTTLFITWNNCASYPFFYEIIFKGSVIITILSIVYLIYSKVRFSYIVYSVLFLFLYLSSNLLESIPRYIIVLFPIYLAFSLISYKNKIIDYLITSSFIMFLTLFIILFTNGYWFT